MLPIITLVISGLLATGIVLVVFRILSKQASASVGKERDIIATEIGLFDTAIERAVSTLGEMVSLDESQNLLQERAALEKSLEVERGKVRKIQNDLQSLQERVDKQEAKHSELKRGKEESDVLAKTLRENRQRFVDEASVLSKSCAELVEGFNAVSSKISKDQLTELESLGEAARITSSQLQEFSEFYSRAANRFINLEKQYSELEREFRKLLDKALAGEEMDGDEA